MCLEIKEINIIEKIRRVKFYHEIYNIKNCISIIMKKN